MTTITLRPDQPFDLDRTLSCGQAFRWEKVEGWWQGIVEGRAIRIRQDADLLTFSGVDAEFICDYFRLDQDLPGILSSIDRDPVIARAIQECWGLRLVRQQPWECLASYICATNTNIPAVKRRIALMAERFGGPVMAPSAQRTHSRSLRCWHQHPLMTSGTAGSATGLIISLLLPPS